MNTARTLDELIQNLLIDEGKNTESEYLRYYNIALRGLKELNIDVQRNIKSVALIIKDNGTIDFPTDYVGYTKLGLTDETGRLHVLGNEKRRVLNPEFTDTLSSASSSSDDYFIFRNFLADGSLGSIYGAGGGNNANGYYTEDRGNNRFLFTGVSTGQSIVLEYITDGTEGVSAQEIKVDPYAEEALMAFIHWRAIQRKRGIQQFEKESARRDYFNEKRLAIARLSKFRKEEAFQASRKGFKQAPKL